MRATLLAVILCCGAVGDVGAQWGGNCTSGPYSPGAPCCDRGPAAPACAPPPCPPPVRHAPPSHAPPMAMPPQPMGAFQQPPATGTVLGAVESLSVQGLEITIPEISLRLPTIRLPSLVRGRTDARMVIDQSVAPYLHPHAPVMGLTAVGPSGVPMHAPAPQAPPSQAPQAAPPPQQQCPAPDASRQVQQLADQVQALQYQLEQSRRLMRQLQSTPPCPYPHPIAPPVHVPHECTQAERPWPDATASHDHHVWPSTPAVQVQYQEGFDPPAFAAPIRLRRTPPVEDGV